MICLSKEEVLILHDRLIDRYGGIHGVRDEDLLDAAMNAPFQSYDGFEFFPSVIDKSVRLCYGLVMDHPFHDGNKRIGTMVLLLTLDLNHLQLRTNSAELSEIILLVAAGTVDYGALLQWVRKRTG